MDDQVQNQTIEAELRERLGRRVHQTWIELENDQSNPNPSWLVSWDKLTETDKKAVQQIGMVIWSDCLKENFHVIARVSSAGDQPDTSSTQDFSADVNTICPSCGSSHWLITSAKIRKVCEGCGYWVPVSPVEAEVSVKNWNQASPYL